MGIKVRAKCNAGALVIKIMRPHFSALARAYGDLRDSESSGRGCLYIVLLNSSPVTLLSPQLSPNSTCIASEFWDNELF
ncbi:hypothetical protein JTE90_004299 [Oedothorax gibbosus]|uniref:Uncharacterized protein n=1 Tax=Oedothorax gibbosus TaxID=931172 RepID=A0AAV6VK85_9ARAC|nr:hypothetical protein JTE90_004299 [Oedothorax gibbosus]